MPVRSKGRGCFQWGHHGKVYCGPGARQKAERQGRAAYSHGYQGHEAHEAATRLTDTQRDVLQLISEGRPLGDYVPSYRPGARRGRGAFPTTIATRAAVQLAQMGLVTQGPMASTSSRRPGS